jgi:hypothetical protein
MPASSSFWQVSRDSSSLNPPSMNWHQRQRHLAWVEEREGLGAEQTYILRIDLDGEQELGVSDFLLDALDDLKQDSGSILEATTVLVGSLIDSWGYKLAKKVTMCTV